MARGVVQQLTPGQWREALEQQIREKREQKEQHRRCRRSEHDGDALSQSAPMQDAGDCIPGLERPAMPSAQDNGQIGGRTRRGQATVTQSREDYLKGLQEQIEEKKRLAQEARDKEQPRCKDASIRFNQQDSALDLNHENVRTSVIMREAFRANDPELSNSQGGLLAVAGALSNQNEDESCKQPPKVESVVDPEAITKLVDFCEDLKKQNEDVKRQLFEQHAVLTSLHSTLTIDGNGASIPPASHSRQGQTVSRSSKNKTRSTLRHPRVGEEALKTKKSDDNGGKEKPKPVVLAPVVPRPRPMRGMTKIPFPSKGSLRSAGARIISGMDTKEETHQHLPVSCANSKAASLGNKVSPNTRSNSAINDFHAGAAEEKVVIENKCVDGMGEFVSFEFKSDAQNLSRSVVGELDCNVQDDEALEANINEGKGDPVTCTREEANLKSMSVDGATTCICLDSESRFVAQDSNLDQILIERPMEADSKLVHDWDADFMSEELSSCTSSIILGGPSLLIPLNQSVSRLF